MTLMKWYLRSDKEPDPKLFKYILVIGKCGKPHVAYYDYGDWNHTECCHESGGHSPGMVLDFERWMPLNQFE